jgi:hypothetical protein
MIMVGYVLVRSLAAQTPERLAAGWRSSPWSTYRSSTCRCSSGRPYPQGVSGPDLVADAGDLHVTLLFLPSSGPLGLTVMIEATSARSTGARAALDVGILE